MNKQFTKNDTNKEKLTFEELFNNSYTPNRNSYLLPHIAHARLIVNKVFDFGSKKYGRNNFLINPEDTNNNIRILQAFNRHFKVCKDNPKALDGETKLPHAFHAICNIIMLDKRMKSIVFPSKFITSDQYDNQLWSNINSAEPLLLPNPFNIYSTSRALIELYPLD